MSFGVHAPTTLVLIAITLVYSLRWVQLRRVLASTLSAWRLLAFVSGVFVLWIAVGSPLAALDHRLLLFHMVQHLLLMTVAAPLILVAEPAIIFLHGLPLRLVPANPLFCWLASTASIIGWHVPVVFQLGMQSEAWHEIEQASFFGAGLLFWLPLIQPWPSYTKWPGWSAPLYLFLATLPCDVLSAFLTFCDRVVYPHYSHAHSMFGMSPLGDQESAGALMWVCITFAYLTPAAVITVQLLSPRNERAWLRPG